MAKKTDPRPGTRAERLAPVNHALTRLALRVPGMDWYDEEKEECKVVLAEELSAAGLVSGRHQNPRQPGEPIEPELAAELARRVDDEDSPLIRVTPNYLDARARAFIQRVLRQSKELTGTSDDEPAAGAQSAVPDPTADLERRDWMVHFRSTLRWDEKLWLDWALEFGPVASMCVQGTIEDAVRYFGWPRGRVEQVAHAVGIQLQIYLVRNGYLGGE